MSTEHRAKLATIKRLDQLIAYLRDEMGWPIARDSFEEVDDLFYDFTAEELGIDPKTAAKIQEIRRLRPLSPRQPWGIFFVKFEPKKLPVVALRRILSQVALKKRASVNSAERAAWAADDLLFISNYGEGDERQISFAHFSRSPHGPDIPTLKVLGWDNLDTALHLDAVARELTQHLAWPEDDGDSETWRERWRSAFTLGHREVVATSRDLSIRLAELARAIRDRIKTALAIETDKGPLTYLMKAFQTALVHDLDADGFADMYAQTIAYGLLSARITDPHRKTADDFASQMRTNPFLRELMETFLKIGGRLGKAGGPGIDFDELGVSDIVKLLDDANMDAVLRDFGDRNPQEDPVIHFYELFLKEYDARKRMQRGVFYTPRPVVSYIVRSLDVKLRNEFGLSDGLADTTTWGEMSKRHKHLKIPEGVSIDQDFVQILDPATGTGTFLVEVIDFIYKIVLLKWKALGYSQKKIHDLWNEYVPKHLLTRLHGYELLMAPYAIAHLKIGLKLYETGYRFESDERARIYLTNALEPPQDFSGRFEFVIPALAHEAQVVNNIKRQRRFTVIIGNPPYSGHSANNSPWITSLVRDYYFIDGKPLGEANPKYLLDDYVKFIRFAQHCIMQSSIGLIGLITNNGYLDNPTFRGMRQQLLLALPKHTIVNLHGSTKKRELTPDGRPDANVFDIQQGVSISLSHTEGLCVQTAPVTPIQYSDLWGDRTTKYSWLNEPVDHDGNETYNLSPCMPYFLFTPAGMGSGDFYFKQGWILTDVFAATTTGVKTHRDHFAYSSTSEELECRINKLRDINISTQTLRNDWNLKDTRDWHLDEARSTLRKEQFSDWIARCTYRPFDVLYYYASGSVVELPRLELMMNLLRYDNLALGVGRQGLAVSEDQWDLAIVSSHPLDANVFRRGGVQVFPLFVATGGNDTLLAHQLSPNFREPFLAVVSKQYGFIPSAIDLLRFIYAELYSPKYRQLYADYLAIDFPRILLPKSLDLFNSLSEIGGKLISIHLFKSSKSFHTISEYRGPHDLTVEKVAWSNNTVWLNKAQTAGFKGVREEVWNFHIGGYKVCEKWLKDRKRQLLTKDDIAHYQNIIFAIDQTIQLMKDIDKVISKHGGWPGAFQIIR